MRHKLILGTAGLGGHGYGRNGRCVDANDAAALIREALSCGITRFDTSPAYGNAESILRHTLRGRGEVWTKVHAHNDVAFAAARTGGELAHVLVHNWKPGWFDRWTTARVPDGFSGVTTYSHDLKRRLRLDGGWIQCDWNLLSQTPFQKIFGPRRGFIARSVLLQGALADGPVPDRLANAVGAARRCARALNIPLHSLALRAALENPEIDYVVVGPTTIDELYSCLNVASWAEIGTQLVTGHLDVKPRWLTDPRTFP